MIAAVHQLILDTVYSSASLSSLDDFKALFPEGDVDARLQKVLAQTLSARLPLWRSVAVRQRPALPKYVDVDWRVDLVSASERGASLAVPTAVVSLKVQDQPRHVDEMPEVRPVTFELKRGACCAAVARSRPG